MKNFILCLISFHYNAQSLQKILWEILFKMLPRTFSSLFSLSGKLNLIEEILFLSVKCEKCFAFWVDYIAIECERKKSRKFYFFKREKFKFRGKEMRKRFFRLKNLINVQGRRGIVSTLRQSQVKISLDKIKKIPFLSFKSKQRNKNRKVYPTYVHRYATCITSRQRTVDFQLNSLFCQLCNAALSISFNAFK